MTSYNYDEFSPDHYDFNSNEGPEVGDKAPNFHLITTDDQARDLLDFEGDFLVLELGSMTCPLFQSRRSGMQPLEQEFDNIDSAILYVREAHPGKLIPAHKNLEEKSACASMLGKNGETRTVFVDDFEGSAHLAYGSMPNAIFIIDREHIVRFKSQWNNPSATRKALKALTQGREVRVKSYFKPATPAIAHKTLKDGGEGSAEDFFKSLPILIWNNVIKYNLRLLFSRS